MASFKVIAVIAVFLVVTSATLGDEEKGIKQKLKSAEETTEKVEVDVGHIIGIAAFTPIVFSSCLVWRLISAPINALKDTVEAVTTVYKNLKEGTDEEQAV